MKYWRAFLVVAAVSSVGLCAGAGRREESLRVATLNCWSLSAASIHERTRPPATAPERERAAWSERWTDADLRAREYALARVATAKLIAALDADVIVLTEVGPKHEVEALRSDVITAGVEYPHLSVSHTAGTPAAHHVAVLSRADLSEVKTRGVCRIPGSETYTVPSESPDAEATVQVSRGLHVTFSRGRSTVHLYGAQFAGGAGSPDDSRRRAAQANIVRRHVVHPAGLLPGAVHRPPGWADYAIVAGDFGERRTGEAVMRLRGRDDMYEDLVQTGDARYFDEGQRAERWTCRYRGGKQQSDQILLSQSLVRAAVPGGIRSEIVDPPPGVSDHRAFVVTLRLPDRLPRHR